MMPLESRRGALRDPFIGNVARAAALPRGYHHESAQWVRVVRE